MEGGWWAALVEWGLDEVDGAVCGAAHTEDGGAFRVEVAEVAVGDEQAFIAAERGGGPDGAAGGVGVGGLATGERDGAAIGEDVGCRVFAAKGAGDLNRVAAVEALDPDRVAAGAAGRGKGEPRLVGGE